MFNFRNIKINCFKMADFVLSFFSSAELLVGPNGNWVCKSTWVNWKYFYQQLKQINLGNKKYPSHRVISTAQKTQSHQKVPHSSRTFCSVKHDQGQTFGIKTKVILALLQSAKTLMWTESKRGWTAVEALLQYATRKVHPAMDSISAIMPLCFLH